jgi:hypothetical protein
VTAPTRRAPALLRSIGEHFTKLSQRLHVDTSLNVADASEHAADALRDAGYKVSEEPFTKMVRRPYNRSIASAVWFAGAAGIAVATFFLASGRIGKHLIEAPEVIALAVSAWTVLLDRWYAQKSRAVPSSNIAAIRGEPRIWLVGTLATEREGQEPRLRPFLEIVIAMIAATYVVRTPGFEKIAWLLPLGVAYGALHWFLRRRFGARTPLALTPATGAAAILGVCEQLTPDQDIGIVLTRDPDPEGRAIRWALAGRREAITILIGQVGGPEELQFCHAKNAREILARFRSAADAEDLQLDVAKLRVRTSWYLAGREERAIASATLSRPTRPIIARHVFAGIFSRADHRRAFDPVEQIARASRLLVHVIKEKPEGSK